MNEKKTIEMLRLLSDETRFKIVKSLLGGEKCVCEIFPRVGRTQSTVSIHLGHLEESGILKSRRAGKRIFYSIKDARICDIFKALGFSEGKTLKKSCCMEGK